MSRAQVRHEDGSFSVYVNGARLVDRESFAIAERIAERVNDPSLDDASETTEVARSIRDWLESADARERADKHAARVALVLRWLALGYVPTAENRCEEHDRPANYGPTIAGTNVVCCEAWRDAFREAREIHSSGRP